MFCSSYATNYTLYNGRGIPSAQENSIMSRTHTLDPVGVPRRIRSLLLLTSLAVVASSCSSSLDNSGQTDPNDSATTVVASDVSLPLPAGVSGMRSVDLDSLYAIVTVTGLDPLIFRQSQPVEVSFRVARGNVFTANIRWFEELANEDDLLLAATTVRQVVTDSVNLNLESDGYTTEGTNFDRDSDGFSNLAERQAGTDPTGSDDSPNSIVDVRLNRVDPSQAPVIDGLYDDIYTTAAQFQDDRGEPLNIDNLMIDQGALRPDGETEFRWFGMHDDTFLYLYVLGENVAIANPVRDSTDIFRDDSIDIFIDGDNSKGANYDGVDDRHLLIPLLTDPDNLSGSNSTAFVMGPNSASLPPIEFATCLCTSEQHTWEIKLPLAGFGIVKDRPFGLEIQFNLDHDGGRRDVKWGWFHPSRVDEDVDNTFQMPSFMGTAVIR